MSVINNANLIASGQAPMHQILNSRFGSNENFNSNSVAALAGTNKDMLEKALIPGAKEMRQPIIPNIQQY